MSIARRFIQSAVLDYEAHEVVVDGACVPYWLALDGPTVERYDDPQSGLHILHLPVLVEGVIIIKDAGADQIIDPILGNVGEWASKYVSDALAARLPWLSPGPDAFYRDHERDMRDPEYREAFEQVKRDVS